MSGPTTVKQSVVRASSFSLDRPESRLLTGRTGPQRRVEGVFLFDDLDDDTGPDGTTALAEREP
jgi:hypothetical protein